MKTLLLTSAGMNVKEEIFKILPKPANQTKVAHIITASKMEDDTSYVEKDKRSMEEAGFQVTDIDIAGKSENELMSLLKDLDVIYVQGGKTFYLLKAVRESGFDRIIKELIENGIVYIGVSAGSIIAGPTIETSIWKGIDKNKFGVTDFTGLNFVPFNIFVHYTEQYRELFIEESKKSSYSVRILTDDQAFLVQDGEVRLVGKGDEVKL